MLNKLGIEWPRRADKKIPIGGSSYTLSAEAQQFIPKELDSRAFLYKAGDRSVLIVNEPHEYVDGQINLFHGLEIFFGDNPGLAEKTIFLSEGYPADQLISVQPLIEAEPNPSDELIHEVLGTFLITGYMAYEWKHQQGIPIVGTEEEWLYFMGRDFNNMWRRDPKLKLGQFGLPGRKPVDITTETMFEIACLLRNKKIAETFFDKMQYYENPLLFVGGSHLTGKLFGDDEAIKVAVKYMAKMGFNGPFHEYASLVEKEAEVKGIADYLEAEKIGLTYLNPLKPLIHNKKIKPDEVAYLKLFEFQQQGEDSNRRWDNHRQYVEWLLSLRRGQQKTTTKASPEAAAEYVKALKGEIIFEEKTTTREGRWYQVPVEFVRQRLGQDSMWDKGIAPRGGNYERLRGANLASNFPVVDHYDSEARTVTSLKTLELTSEFYQEVDNIEYMVGRDVNELSEFQGAHWTLKGKPILIEKGIHFDDRYLEIAIPAGKATPRQREKLKQLQEFAQSVDVILDIVEVP